MSDKSKRERHAKIVDLINRYDIDTQEELAARLREDGFEVTQATVSRDIREMMLSKVTSDGGRQRYALTKRENDHTEKYANVLREGFISIESAQNILVIKTMVGMAMAVAAALDAMKMDEVLGCIAGDDTIFCVLKTTDDAIIVTQRLKNMIS